MELINATSVSDALATSLVKFANHGIREESRNGAVLVMPTPVTTTYYQPQNRVLFSKHRNANPFFHLMESLWMLAGKNDLLFPMQFNQRFREYSDDGGSIWGAYGWRWREFFGYDQLDFIVDELRSNPGSRRAVLAMWNAAPHLSGVEYMADTSHSDLLVAIAGGKDVPCNTHAYFDCRGGVLNMTVCNRSNDAWWGAYGANAVHFSILLEYMAARIGIPMGVYRQVSNNLHLYSDVVNVEPAALMQLAAAIEDTDMYNRPESGWNGKPTMPIVDCDINDWHVDLTRLLSRDRLDVEAGWNSTFLMRVALPMMLAYDAWRNKQYTESAGWAHAIHPDAWDWQNACMFWLHWRAQARDRKENV